MARMPHVINKELTLSLRLQWHVANCLQQAKGCAVLVLQVLGPGGDGEGHWPVHASSAEVQRVPEGRLSELTQRMGPLLRRSDPVECEEGFGIGIVLLDAGMEGIQSVRQRLRRALEEVAPSQIGYDEMAQSQNMGLLLGYASLAPVADTSQIPNLARALVRAACEPIVLLSVTVAGRMGGTRAVREPHTDPDTVRSSGEKPQNEAGRPARSGSRAAHRPGLHLLAGAVDTNACYDGLRQRAGALGVPYVCLPTRLPDSCCQAISVQLARELHAVPIGRTRGTLTVAMQDPTNAEAMQRLGVATGLTIFPVLASAGELEHALEQLVLAAERGACDTHRVGL